MDSLLGVAEHSFCTRSRRRNSGHALGVLYFIAECSVLIALVFEKFQREALMERYNEITGHVLNQGLHREAGTPKILVRKFYYSRAPCLDADQKTHGLGERDWLNAK